MSTPNADWRLLCELIKTWERNGEVGYDSLATRIIEAGFRLTATSGATS